MPPDTRPASERVRQAVFSSLAVHVPDARVLDLYCGSGAYGLEALSRGAERAVFVDANRRSVEAVRRNAGAAGLDGRCVARRRDVDRFLEGDASADGPFDLVFLDPPYGEEGAVERVLRGLDGALVPGAWVVGEVRWAEASPPAADGYLLEDDRRYGDTRVLVYRRGGTPEEAGVGRG